MEISNKLLATLLVVAIVVSVGGAMINMAKLSELARVVPLVSRLTGAAYSAGTVNISVIEQAEVNISTYEVNFGAGFVTESDSARLGSNGTVTNWSAAGTSSGLVIENTGNVNVTLNMTSDVAAAAFLGGTGPTFKYNTTSDEAYACHWNATSGIGNLSGASYSEVTTATQKVCDCFRDEAANDQISMNFEVVIPTDSAPGAKNATLTFSASSVAGNCHWSNK